MCYGLILIWGGWPRFSLGLHVVLQNIPAAPYIIGGMWIVAGFVTLIGQWRDHCPTRNVGLLAIAVLCLGQVGVTAWALTVEPRASAGSTVVFGTIALQVMVLRRLGARRTTHDAQDS